MPRFTCVKPTTFKGRQVQIGAGMMVSARVAETFKGNASWKLEDAPKAPDDKKAKKDAEAEVERQELLETAKAMGLKPNARTGSPKLQEMIEEAKRVKSDPVSAGAKPASII